MSDRKATVDGVQTVLCIAGVALGVVPLIQSFINADQSEIYDWLFGKPRGTMAWLVPLAVTVVVAAVVIAIEPLKRK